MKLLRTFAAVGGLSVLLLGGAVTPALAEPIERGQFHEVFSDTFVDCGLEIGVDVDLSGSYVVNARGRDGQWHGQETRHGTIAWTNLTTGKSITLVTNAIFKDLQVSDNGDGTYTVLWLGTGSDKFYGPDGEYLYNNPGQIRAQELWSDGGTAIDRSDDELLDWQLVKGSTGRNDLVGVDFCDVFLEVTG